MGGAGGSERVRRRDPASPVTWSHHAPKQTRSRKIRKRAGGRWMEKVCVWGGEEMEGEINGDNGWEGVERRGGGEGEGKMRVALGVRRKKGW